MGKRDPAACVLDDARIEEARVEMPMIPPNVPTIANPVLYNVHRHLDGQGLASCKGGPYANPPTVDKYVSRVINVVKAFHRA